MTNEAILLDTAGRWSTDDDDREEWLAFLDLLKKTRPKKPINGILLAISATDLQGNEEQIGELATTLRERIDEVIARLELVVPVYLIITKCDLISGFVETFGEPHTYDETVAPYGSEWPGLAPATAPDADPEARAAEIADSLADSGSWLKDARLALVPARRSADIPAAIGWSGPVNYEGDVARLCAVLRSWEDRFGIRVVALTVDQLVLSVAAPPTTTAEAEAIAAEHFAFCPDNITQGHHETLRAYAAHDVLGQKVWSFWWD